MRILQLCNKPPQPKIDGGCIAMSAIAEGLIKAGHEIDILSISTFKHPFELQKFSQNLRENCKIEAVFVNTKINVVDAFSALLSNDSYNVNRFFSPDFDFKLIRWLSEKSYDIIQLESLFMTPYIPSIRKLSKAKIILRSHNLEHIIWQRLADNAGFSPKKMYLIHLAKRLKKYESTIIKNVDGIATISDEDTLRFRAFNCPTPIETISFGINSIEFDNAIPAYNGSLKMCHIGAMDWKPNIEAVNFILHEIWPELDSNNLELNIAGKAMPDALTSFSAPAINILGEVSSAKNFMAENHILLVPLFSGSGIRVKIIEGMALGKIVITTTLGAEGIDYENEKHLFIANSVNEFCAIVRKIQAAPELIEKIGTAARLLIQEKYNNSHIIDKLVQFYQTSIDAPSI